MRARNGRGRRERSRRRWYRPPLMRQVRPTSPTRLIALLAVMVALLVGAAACSGNEAPEAAPDDHRRAHADHGPGAGRHAHRHRQGAGRDRLRRAARRSPLRRDHHHDGRAEVGPGPDPAGGPQLRRRVEGGARLPVRQPDLLRQPAGHAGPRGARRLAEGADPGPPEPHRGLGQGLRRRRQLHHLPHGAVAGRPPPHRLRRRRPWWPRPTWSSARRPPPPRSARST